MLEWFEAAGGGLLIGLSVLLMMASLGRVASASAVLFRALETKQRDPLWRLLFLFGLLLSGLVFGFVGGYGRAAVEEGYFRILCAGVLVGVGATMISGGMLTHAVIGAAAGARRSWLAAAIILCSAAMAVWLFRHGWGAA